MFVRYKSLIVNINLCNRVTLKDRSIYFVYADDDIILTFLNKSNAQEVYESITIGLDKNIRLIDVSENKITGVLHISSEEEVRETPC